MTETQDSPVDGPASESPERREPLAVAVGLAVGAAASLAAVLFSLRSQAGMSDGLDQTGVMILALSLFSPIIVAMFAGGAGGLLVSRLTGTRAPLTAAGFAAVGLIAGGTAYALFSVDGSIALALALILFASAVAGGLFALVPRRMPVAAGLAATFALLLLMFLRGILDSSSRSMFSDPLDRLEVFGAVVPFAAGLVCGFTAYLILRTARAGTRLYGYLFAGAMPGAVWLLATAVAQVGVEVVLALGVDRVSSLDEAYLKLAFQWQYNGAMTALFAGAVCSVLAYGLLLPKAPKGS